MTDQEPFAARFSAEVDRILEQQGRAEDAGPPSEYADMLALAERLAALDFSKDNPLRPQLRRQLLNRLQAERSAVHLRPRGWRRIFFPRPARALGILAALTALVVLVGFTPPGRAVAQAVGQFIQEMRWPHTTLRQVFPARQPTTTPEDTKRFAEESAAGRAWEFRFDRYAFSGCCYSEAVRDEVLPLSLALDEAGFGLQLPGFLPEGFVLSEVRVLGAAPYDVFVLYEGTEGRLLLYQSLVGVTSEERRKDNVVVVEKRKMDVLTDRSVEEVMVGPTQAALTDGESLTWEENDVSFRLIGPRLDAQTLVRIAESLAPVR